MEGAPVLEPIEHSVLEKSLDGGPMEGKTMLEPLEHSVLAIILNGEPMEGGDSFGTVRAFGSGKAPGRWTSEGDIGYGTV